MVLLRVGLALVGLLVIGCGNNAVGQNRVDLPSNMTIHPSFGEQATVIVDAANEWKRATGGVAELHPSIGDDGTVRVSEVFDGSADYVGITHSELWTAEVHVDMLTLDTQATASKVSVDEELKDTVMHELGHAFGLPHMATGLMKAEGYGGGCIDQLTLDAFCGNYSCPASAAPTCD